MKKQYTGMVISVMVFFALVANAQEPELRHANKKYEELSYIDATKIYLKVAESGHRSEELFKKLGDIFYFKANYTEAEKWYLELYKLNNDAWEAEHLLRYAQSLKAVGKEKEAEKIYDAFLSSADILNDEFSTSSDYLKIIGENSNRYSIAPLSINSEGIDYGSFIHNDTLYFSSSRSLGRKKIIDTWSNRPFLDIYTTNYNEIENTYGKPTVLKGDVNTKFHESSPVIAKDGKTLYFTGTSITQANKKNKQVKDLLKIYKATKVKGKWTDIEDLSINGDDYSNAHPALSPDGKTLYFTSNMPTSLGQTDIFSVSIHTDGSLGKPINLGSKINTKGRESFPFITQDNGLYFSSDGHFGLGGYDVFFIALNAKEMKLLNVGKPVNGPTDDFAFSINDKTKKGFFSSTRSGTDNIYGFLETTPIKDLLQTKIMGTVTGGKAQRPLESAMITVMDRDNKIIATGKTDKEGKYTVNVDKLGPHIIKVEKRDYDATDKLVTKRGNIVRLDFQLAQNVFRTTNESEAAKRLDLAVALNLNQIYFDFNSSYLREEAKTELAKISVAMGQYPKIRIEIGAHTDSRGTDKYNTWLSIRRAERATEYLIKKGIDKSRIIFKGYGETKPVNDCKNNVVCTEKEHRQNRRIEFMIRN